MKIRIPVLAVIVPLLVLVAAQAIAQTPARLSDKQVKQLIVDAREAAGRFVDKMDPQMRTAVLKGEGYTIDVKASLNEMEDLGKQAERAFNPPSNAGTEVMAYLKKLVAFDRGLAQRRGMSGADKYWEDAKPAFGRLAAAYRIDWNSDSNTWSPRRVSDAEVKAAADDIKKLSGTLGKAIDNALKSDKGITKAAREGMVAQVKGIETAANDFGTQFKNGRDAAPALARISAAVDTIPTAVPAPALAGPAGATLETIKSKLSLLNLAFGS
jgi:hypothetical protein